MDNQTTKFLTLYRAYESYLREQGMEYKAVEDAATGQKQDRMRICRQIRNYLVHQEDAGFLAVSDLQLQFLETLCTEAKHGRDTAGDHTEPLVGAGCTPEDAPEIVLKRMKRKKTCFLPVYTLKNRKNVLLGEVSLIQVALALSKGSKQIGDGIRKFAEPPLILPADTLYKDVLEQLETVPVICITEDGTMNGHLYGACMKENGKWK